MNEKLAVTDTISIQIIRGVPPPKVRKIVAVGGVPGTGKTTLFRKFMESLTWENQEPEKLVSAMYNKEHDLYVLGKYEEGQVFAGTDRLSMACQPMVEKFITNTTSNVLYEGDRIFNQSFLEFCMILPETKLEVIYLKTAQDTLSQRYTDRGSDQSEIFLKGRATKYNNILCNFELMSYITEFNNETFEDQSKVLSHLSSILLEN